MWCYKHNKNVLTGDCDKCISERQCYQWCMDHYGWGLKDDKEPIFANRRRKNFSRKPLSKFWLEH